jgi:DNA repair exonuclease SbcCD ATPase subunit
MFNWLKRLFCEAYIDRIKSLESQLENTREQLKTCEKTKEIYFSNLKECSNKLNQAKERTRQLEALNQELNKKLEASRRQLNNFQESLKSCEETKQTLLAKLEECSSQLDRVKERVRQLETENAELHKQVRELQEDLNYFKHRTELLLQALGEAITIPDIKEYVKERTLIKPYELDALQGYDLLCADSEYYAFPREAWIGILNLVHQQVKKILGAWRREIANCDNWALLTCVIAYLAFDKAGLDRQGAVSIAWSRTHAYNAYVPSDDLRTWLYEPQSNTHVGILSKEAVETYRTWGIWFMGKKVV